MLAKCALRIVHSWLVNKIIKFLSRHLPYMVKHKVMLDNGVPIVRRSFLL